MTKNEYIHLVYYIQMFSLVSIPVLRSKRPTLRLTPTGSGVTKTGRSPAQRAVGCQGAKTSERGACPSPQVGFTPFSKYTTYMCW